MIEASTTDLSAVASQLERANIHRKLAGIIRVAQTLGSAEQDLEDAAARLRHLIDNYTDKPGPITPEKAMVTGALFSHAVILYARATVTTPIERGRWWGIELIPPALHATHNDVMTLRNEAIAHFGTGAALPDGPLIREGVLRHVGNERVRYVFRSGRAQHQVGFDQRFLDLAMATIAELQPKATEAFDAIDEELAHALESDPNLRPILVACTREPTDADKHEIATLHDAGDIYREAFGVESRASKDS